MSAPKLENKADHALGGLLRYWRQQRGMSQLALSLETGVSQRHISFIESGRSTPGRDVLLNLSRKLDIPLRERNVLLRASGYSPVYLESSWDSPEMLVVTRAVDRILAQHEPHPALVLDRYWNILRTNEAAPRFFNRYCDLSTRKKPRNLLHLMFDPTGMRPFIEDWDNVAAGLLERVHREALGHILDDKTVALLKDLHEYPEVEHLGTVWESQYPVLPITFTKDSERISYFSVLSTVGTPQCITAQEFRIECMFPADSGDKNS